jgi:hypothetical protein
VIRQRILADPARGDGHDADGNPGDCLRTAVACLLEVSYRAVPHFAQHVGWWDCMRRWARGRGVDVACIPVVDGSVRYGFEDPPPASLRMLGCGPSPRGPFWHVVLVDLDLHLVHDPHPSDAGLVEVAEVFVFCPPYDPPPGQLLLEGMCA